MAALVVFCTASSMQEARQLVDVLINEKLAACVSMVPSVHSTYWWKGKVERAEEVLLIIKTASEKFAALTKRIKTNHSYTVPEVLALPVLKGNPDYLKWLKQAVSK